MNQLQDIDIVLQNFQGALSWKILTGETVSEEEFLREISRLPLETLLPGLIRLLQYGDLNGLPAYRKLDSMVCDLFPIGTANKIKA